MDTRARITLGQRIYDDFIPEHRKLQDEKSESLVIELHGFRKDQIKVQIDKYGKLRISGEMQLVDNRWHRFQKEYQVPDNCNASAIRAKFENGLLQITLPKLVTSAQEQEATGPSLPPNGSKPRTGQELTSQKTILRTADDSYDNDSKQQDAKAGEQTAASVNAQKAEEKEKDPVEESEDTGKSEKDHRRAKTTDAGGKKEAVTTQRDYCTGDLKSKTQGICGSGSYWRRQRVLRMSMAALVLVGIMLYATYKLKNACTYRQVED